MDVAGQRDLPPCPSPTVCHPRSLSPTIFRTSYRYHQIEHTPEHDKQEVNDKTVPRRWKVESVESGLHDS